MGRWRVSVRDARNARFIAAWEVSNCGNVKFVMEPEFMVERFGHSTRRFVATVVSRLRRELEAKKVVKSRVGMFRFICEDAPFESTKWLKE